MPENGAERPDDPEIAAYFERTPGGIRARLPRVGCDPENPGCYLPVPPSRRTDLDGGEPT